MPCTTYHETPWEADRPYPQVYLTNVVVLEGRARDRDTAIGVFHKYRTDERTLAEVVLPCARVEIELMRALGERTVDPSSVVASSVVPVRVAYSPPKAQAVSSVQHRSSRIVTMALSTSQISLSKPTGLESTRAVFMTSSYTTSLSRMVW